MSEDQQRVWEYANYALALAGLAVVFVISLRRRIRKERAYAAQLGISS